MPRGTTQSLPSKLSAPPITPPTLIMVVSPYAQYIFVPRIYRKAVLIFCTF
uniref:Uncharacterized protein n=1 Tax=Anguilla anguilla TaxID=7936 RepID=A0A0E9T0V0_ANGAN